MQLMHACFHSINKVHIASKGSRLLLPLVLMSLVALLWPATLKQYTTTRKPIFAFVSSMKQYYKEYYQLIVL